MSGSDENRPQETIRPGSNHLMDSQVTVIFPAAAVAVRGASLNLGPDPRFSIKNRWVRQRHFSVMRATVLTADMVPSVFIEFLLSFLTARRENEFDLKG